MARKKKIYPGVKITGIAHKGKAVGRNEEGRVFFVEGAVPGDVVEVQALRKKKSVWMGRVTAYESYSPDRVEAKCDHFGVCGGCKWQHYDYQKQLEQKQIIVRDALVKIGKLSEDIMLPIVGAGEQYRYRNKLEYSFSSQRWLTEEEINSDETFEERDALGFHKAGAYNKVVDIQTCHLQEEISDKIRNWIRDYGHENQLSFFDIRANKGFFRNVIVRTSTTGDLMVILSIGAPHKKEILKLCEDIKNAFPQITSLHYVINQKMNDTILDQDIICYHGEPFIVEKLGGVSYRIGPKSFFQTNSLQAKTLYDLAIGFAELTGAENIFDLYCGLGSIGLYMADRCKQVVGIEIVPEAIEDAVINRDLNHIKNAHFHAGDVKDILDKDFIAKYGTPDMIMTDPPRAGMHKEVALTLLEIAAPKIVYISCNPATQARDLEILSSKYEVVKSQAVDMFPHTSHIENICLLKLRP